MYIEAKLNSISVANSILLAVMILYSRGSDARFMVVGEEGGDGEEPGEEDMVRLLCCFVSR